MILEGEDGRTRELPFLLIALALHAAALSFSGAQGPRTPHASDAVAVDFVAQLPKAPAPPTPELAPVAAALKPEPQAEPTPTPHPAKKTVHPRKRISAEQMAAIRAKREAARAARIERQRLLAEQRAAAKAEAERQRQARLEAQRVAREARIAAATAAAEKAAHQRAELQNALASMKDPDEKLSDAVADPDTLASGNVAPAGGAAAAFAPSNTDSVYDVQRDGVDPAKQAGGGGGTAWSIAGPAGNRRIIHQRLPKAPRWMAERGLELAVSLRFEVMPDGSVRRSAVVRKTSGFPEVDRAALDAIRSWKFERLAPGVADGSVWGDVTLRFLLG